MFYTVMLLSDLENARLKNFDFFMSEYFYLFCTSILCLFFNCIVSIFIPVNGTSSLQKKGAYKCLQVKRQYGVRG